MESFFLSETTKYLYLLHCNATALPDFYVFSTEGHLLPVLPAPTTAPAAAAADDGGAATAGADQEEYFEGGRCLLGIAETFKTVVCTADCSV